jgi:hypothetical protein
MEWLTYLLKVTACTVLFFGFYLLFLRKLTFFKINRFYLLVTLLLSFVIPALQFEVKREMAVVETKVTADIPEVKPINSVPVQLIQPIMVEYQPELTPKIDWLGLIPYAYGGTALLLLLICLWRLFALLKHTSDYTKNGDGLKLISKTSGFTNCSFFNYVFIDGTTLSDTDLAVLLKHEQVHARQYHSIDKILLMIFKAVLWFNPIVYLYDKALEQVHEYEADEITSSNYGSQAYANLLLKLAIAKSDVSLVHNFVKSPIKARIKMLFHSKSKNMKKLSYLMTLPVVMGLIWLFAVQMVYAQNKSDESKPSKDFFQGTLKGKVLNIRKEAIGFYTFDLLSDGKIYPIEATTFKEKIKVGDELIAYISGKGANMKKMDKSGKVIAELNGPIYNSTKVTTLTGSLIYERKIENHAFIYEANKARSVSSKIKSIDRDVNDKIEKIVLKDGLFTINLNLQNIKDDHFKVGDRVLVKFIGEKLVSKNTYTTDKMIVLYSEPKRYMIKNEPLYNRFYFNDGKQKVAVVKNEAAKVLVEPKIISFSKLTGFTKNKISYMENAVIEIKGGVLKAKKVEWNKNANTITAKGPFFERNGKIQTGDKMVFDLVKNSIITFLPGQTEFHVPANAVKDVHYKADTVLLSKDKSIVTMLGNASFWSDFHGRYSGSKIIYNSAENTASIINANVYAKEIRRGFRADSIKIDLKAGKTLQYGYEPYQL